MRASPDKTLLSMALLSALTGCDPRLADGSVLPDEVPDVADGCIAGSTEGCFKETYKQPEAQVTDKLDVLFVIDTSASLIRERVRLLEAFDDFTDQLSPGTHYRVGVMLAHGSRSAKAGRLHRTIPGNSPILDWLEPYVLDSQRMSSAEMRIRLQIRMLLPSMDYWADGGEEGLWSLWRATEADRVAEIKSQGFFRDDAALTVVFISDEEDICAVLPEGVTANPDRDFYEGVSLEQIARDRDCVQNGQAITPHFIADRLKALKGQRPVKVSGIVYNDRENVPRGIENEYGYGFMELIDLTGGVSVDLRLRDFDEGMAEIGRMSESSLHLFTSFSVQTNDIDPETIVVKVDGLDVPFVYHEDLKRVNLAPENAGHASSVVEIEYCVRGVVDNNDDDTDNDNDDGTDDGTNDDDTEGDGTDDGSDDNTDDGSDDGTDDGGDLPPGCTAIDCPDTGI
jgi:hypothetical protein